MAPLVPFPLRHNNCNRRRGSCGWATGACPLCATGWVTTREALRMAPQVPVPPCHFLPPAPRLVDVT